jgi:hypothetical protein
MPPRTARLSPSTAAVLLVVAALLAACATPSAPTEAPSPAMLAAVRKLAPHSCNAGTAAALDRMGVQPGQVSSITYDRRIGTNKNILQGYDVWVERTDQPGYIVIRMNRFCRPFASAGQG